MERQKLLWCGNSYSVFWGFSDNAKEDLGNDLERLRDGLMPLDSKPMGAVLPGVFELRDKDRGIQYRVMYTRTEDAIYVLHCFIKKTPQTPQREIETARQRLKMLKREKR